MMSFIHWTASDAPSAAPSTTLEVGAGVHIYMLAEGRGKASFLTALSLLRQPDNSSERS